LFKNRYFGLFTNIDKYLKQLVADCEEKGYVTTILGRRREVNEIKSSSYMEREFGKRVAMNTPIKGSAADIIKIAMINVRKMLKNNKFKTKMLLQIHDELIFEVPKEELTTIIPLIQNEMESALKLKVPLKVEYGYGSNLYDTK
jgi:DNA polymerase-1